MAWKNFNTWFENRLKKEAADVVTRWTGAGNQLRPEKDPVAGVQVPAKPGFRPNDKASIEKYKDAVIERLDHSTQHLGINWLYMFVEPTEGEEVDAYHQDVEKYALEQLKSHPDFDPKSTIVLDKPTSRVHTLNLWQMLHNVGHAVWSTPKNLELRGEMFKFVRTEFAKMMHYAGDTGDNDLMVFFARFLDNKSLQRLFSNNDVSKGTFRVNTVFSSPNELSNEIIASYLFNRGKIPLHPRGEVKNAAPDRIGKTPHMPGYENPWWQQWQKDVGAAKPDSQNTPKDWGYYAGFDKKPGDWTYEPLPPQAEQIVKTIANSLNNNFIVPALKNCIYANNGNKPVYTTQDLNTLA
jgi:hypothetical protein